MNNEYDTRPGRGVAPYPNLDLASDEWTFQERAETVRWYELSHGTGDTRFAQFVPWMIDNNPADFKRYRGMVPALTGDVPRGIFLVHAYAVTGNATGCMYETIVARQHGFSKRQILDVLNFAFLSSGPRGINEVIGHLGPYLDSWEDQDETGRINFPATWSSSPEVFESGIDYTTVGMTDEELQSLMAWHEKHSGAVPRFVETWAKHRGAAYKANRARYEQATKSRVLPSQVFPLMTMHLGAYEGRPAVVLHALRHLRAVGGVTRSQIVEVIDTAFVFGIEWKMAAVLTDEVCELIEAWPATASDDE